MQTGKKKLVLDHLIVQKMEDDDSKEDVQSILMFGAQTLFQDGDAQDARDIHCGCDAAFFPPLSDVPQIPNTILIVSLRRRRRKAISRMSSPRETVSFLSLKSGLRTRIAWKK